MSRPFSLVRHKAQWERCAHERTTLDPLSSVVSLAEPRPSTQPFAGATGVVAPVGFAVDAACRVFRAIPEEHRVERWLWANPKEPARDVLADPTSRPAAIAFDASQHLRLINIHDHPGEYGVLGASAGGLMSFYTGLRMSEIFGKVLLIPFPDAPRMGSGRPPRPPFNGMR